MRTHIAIGIAALIAAVCGTLLGVGSTISGQKIAAGNTGPEPAPKPAPAPEPEQPRIPALRVYEWGVTTLNWDGTPEAEEVMPAVFYPADRIALEPPMARPEKPPVLPEGRPAPDPKPEPPRPRKPVLYFEHDLAAQKQIQFDLDIRFPNGRVTWVYPKASRRLDAATVQWDSIELVNAQTPAVLGRELPKPAVFPAGHWAETSRAGGGASLYVNGEQESWLFYEGEQFDLPELDIFTAPDGSLRLQNHGAYPVHDVRLAIEGRHYFVPAIAAASGERPTEVTLTESHRVDAAAKPGVLAAETFAAGLTRAQSEVFEKVWQGTLGGVNGTLSWRRTARALDDMAEIKLTLPVGMASEVKRVGYVLVNRLDLGRQPALDAQAAKAAAGDTEAGKALKASGMAGAGALRRRLQDENLALGQRLALAKLLAEMRTR
ncbi:MAG: hypothetical protein HS108_00250 [Planctomycetes bacterium]|jgi:hypothetical protein|nr:hypothetical protein [Planctomycetota bacterium]MCL4730830.1 hypothetical protein [Planctomycetota bacterium]